MARPFLPHEINDPDLEWLITTFVSQRSDFLPVESEGLALMLVPYTDKIEVDTLCPEEPIAPVAKLDDTRTIEM